MTDRLITPDQIRQGIRLLGARLPKTPVVRIDGLPHQGSSDDLIALVVLEREYRLMLRRRGSEPR